MNDFILSLSTVLSLDESISALHHGADILRRDMRDGLTGYGPENKIQVILDKSVGAEQYVAHVTEKEITLTCGDDLGAVYALLSISERCLQVKPLGWWMGLQPKVFDTVPVAPQTWRSPEYAVRFRCWFANDEVLFTGWHIEESQRYALWKRLFETILRCGGNMVIPGTDRAYDGRLLNEMALERGLWITQHHTEILGARMFARAYPDHQPSYAKYPNQFERLWQEAIDLYAGRRVVWCVGFRGQGDRAFWHDDTSYDTAQKQGAFISGVILRQMELVRQKDENAIFSTNLYGEMMGLYHLGYLQVPKEVIKIWGDNGYGKMVSRRQNNDNPRVDAMPEERDQGEHGIYYHVSFYDLQAANHITMLQNPPEMIVNELGKVLEKNAGTLWNINVGSVKPHIFMLDIIRRMWTEGCCDVQKAAEEFARDYYGAKSAAPALTEYAAHAVPYGPNEDDRAGDQYDHFPLRILAHALLRGETDRPLKSLFWAAGETSFADQVKRLAAVAKAGMASWKKYEKLCRNILDELPQDAAARFRDTMLLQAIIHQTGSEGLYSFCQAVIHALNGRDFQAYLWTDKALEANKRALVAMKGVEGRFAHLYDNDCFVGVGLTAQVLTGVRAYFRIRGDGSMLYDWEKKYLSLPEEELVVLQTHRTVQLSDDELCLRLRSEVPLRKAF